MKRNTLALIAGIIVVLVGGGAIIAMSYIQSLAAPKPLEISYATVQTAMPDGASCVGGSEESAGIAKEVINLDTDVIYIAGGANAMPDDVWDSTTFRLPVLKNSTRNLLFGGSCFFRSPSAPADCTGEACFKIEEMMDYSWLELTTIIGQDCFPALNGCRGDIVNPGYVSSSTISKCHRLVFEGPLIYELADGQGNLYVMHATATGTPNLNPELPAGWTLTERTITEPLELLPFGGGDDCYYNIVRDNLVQAYHQYAYAGEQYPPQ